jgi:prepilin-type N-terminal cleavage/methylation domain-containing protein
MKFSQRRKEKGFTLVEVIVVAVIVAVLAAVAIPLYMGYIKDSKINVANNVAGTIASAAGATIQQDKWDAAFQKDWVSPEASAGDPITITFPSVNDAKVNNTIIVPNGYTATITATTDVVFLTTDKTITSRVYTFKQ